MAMIQAHQRKYREYTGATPYSVGIREKLYGAKPPDYLILERRRADEARENLERLNLDQKHQDLRNDWERSTDYKITVNNVKRRVTENIGKHKFELEDRRERLRNLLAAEEEMYMQEMEAKEETVIERQAKMRERAKQLREKREEERLKIVEEKLDQKFRSECEELRTTISKRGIDECAAERMKQLEVKAAQAKRKQEEERFFAEMWYADMHSKAQREEREASAANERHRDVLATQRMQMAALKQKEEEEMRLKQEEADLLRYQHALRKLEEQAMLEEKRRKQAETRDVLDRSLRLKLKKKAKETQEELAFDMKMLEQLLEITRNEAMEQEQRKREMREENQQYRAYLQRMMEEEKLRDKELDKLLDAEVERMWQKRLQQWRTEREARQRLLQEVLTARRAQVEAKVAENERARVEAAQERERILRLIEENKRLEAEQLQKQRVKNLNYQSDLIGQMDYDRRLRVMDEVEREREELLSAAAEREYQAKLRSALENPRLDRVHPARRARSGAPIGALIGH